MAVCRHCGWRQAGRPRGLCAACYYTPGVRDLFAPDPHFVVLDDPAPIDGRVVCIAAPKCRNRIAVDGERLTFLKRLGMPWAICPACAAQVEGMKET